MVGLGSHRTEPLSSISFLLIGSLHHGRYRIQECRVLHKRRLFFQSSIFLSVLLTLCFVLIHGHLILVSSNVVRNWVGPWTHKPSGLLFFLYLQQWLLTGAVCNKIKFVFTKIFLFGIALQLIRKPFLGTFSTVLTHFCQC